MNLRVGVPLVGSTNWHGGITYIEAIIRSLRTLPESEVPKIYLIKDYIHEDGSHEHDRLLKLVEGQVVIGDFEHSTCDEKTIFLESFDKITLHIDFIFPVNSNCLFGYPHATWIPDLQHKYLPSLFSESDVASRDKSLELVAKYAHNVVFSSHASKKDFLEHYPSYEGEVEVIHFYSKFDDDAFLSAPYEVLKKYSLPEKYIICCNQFWQHKNHDILFNAIAMMDTDVHLVCTGATVDYRNDDWFAYLKKLIEELGIKSKISILGFIPREDQVQLIRHSICLVQPSLFEGWSTVLEDARGLGKTAIVSDIEVHREQNIPDSQYFDANSPDQLATILAGVLQTEKDNELSAAASSRPDVTKLQNVEARKLMRLANDVVKANKYKQYEKLLRHLTSESISNAEQLHRKEQCIQLMSDQFEKIKSMLAQSERDVIERADNYENIISTYKSEKLNLENVLIEKEQLIQQQAKALDFFHRALPFLKKIKLLMRVPILLFRLTRANFAKIYKLIKNRLGPKLGNLNQYAPRPISLGQVHTREINLTSFPSVAIVTPSYGQAEFIKETMNSVLDQGYPNLQYFVQDGGSKDGTIDLLAEYDDRLTGWVSEQDNGQSHAINLGFEKTDGEIMAWLNSDDLLLPNTIAVVIDYFNKHPAVDVVYGNRILIDDEGNDIGRWILPGHDGDALSWVDFIPQETMFWRRSMWDKVGGIDESFKFAMDWDLLVRFRDAGAKFAHIPEFLGAFRIHESQKTSANINDIGMREMDRIRERVLGRMPSYLDINKAVAGFMIRHVIYDLIYISKKRLTRC